MVYRLGMIAKEIYPVVIQSKQEAEDRFRAAGSISEKQTADLNAEHYRLVSKRQR